MSYTADRIFTIKTCKECGKEFVQRQELPTTELCKEHRDAKRLREMQEAQREQSKNFNQGTY